MSDNFWTKSLDDPNDPSNPTYTKTTNMQASKSKHPDKCEHLKNLAHRGLRTMKSLVVRNHDELNNVGGAAPLSEYESRFWVSVPRSQVELLEALENGKHPEVLQMAISQRKRLVPISYDHTSEYMILSGMLEAIKERLRSGDLDHIQRKTLDELHREYDWVQYQ